MNINHRIHPFIQIFVNLLQYLSKQNVDRHNKVLTQSTLERVSGGGTTGGNTGLRSKTSTMLHSDVEYDNGNISPLYSNWDQVRRFYIKVTENRQKCVFNKF